MAELRGAGAVLLNLLCAILVVGRLIHAWGVSHTPENFRFRVAGMAATFFTLMSTAAVILLT